MASQSLYRKWRSQTFSDLIGQEAVTQTLLNAVRDGRLAHAYLFCGPRGTGKTSAARLLAKAVNCANPKNGEPCNECLSCCEITAGRSPDVIEIDAASHTGVDNIRDLRENVNLMGVGGHYKIYIIDEVHMLSTSAFNALLKTLEEPPPHIIFVLATTEAHKVLPTVVSRCQRFDFRRFGMRDLVERLYHVAEGEGLAIEPAAADLLARAAQGGMRDALSLLDQAMAFCGTQIDLERTRAMLGLADPGAIRRLITFVAENDAAGGLYLINEMVTTGADLRQLNSQLAEEWRALVLARAGANVAELMDRSDDEAREITALAQRFTLEELTGCARVFARNETPVRGLPVPQLALELSFLDCLAIHAHGAQLDVRPAPQRSSTPAMPPSTLRPAPPTPQPAQPIVTQPIVTQPPVASAPPTSVRPIEELDLDAIERGDAAPTPDIWGTAPATTEADTLEEQLALEESPADVPPLPVAPTEAPEPVEAPVSDEQTQLLELLFRAQEQWDLVKQVCKQKSHSVAALLHSARPVQLEPGQPPSLVIQATYQFHLDKLREPASRAAVEWSLEQVLEQPIRMKVTLATSGGNGGGGTQDSSGNGGSNGIGGSGGSGGSSGNGRNGRQGGTGRANEAVTDLARPGGTMRAAPPMADTVDAATAARLDTGDTTRFGNASNVRPFSKNSTAANGTNGNGRPTTVRTAVRDESAAYAAEPFEAAAGTDAGHISNITPIRRAAPARADSRPVNEMPRQFSQEQLETEVRSDPVIQSLLRTQGIELVDVRALGEDE